MRYLRELVRRLGPRELALIIFTALVTAFVDVIEKAAIWAFNWLV
ncbi:hypothetical protein ACFV13_21240 [Streptomyces bauhiniae]